jgi:hypothetical protein
MIGLGPTPGWQYLNAIKIGIIKVPITGTNPVQYYEYDDLEYIHPSWDASLDYSKPLMPTRVWHEGKLYTPGSWLTSSKIGGKPNEVECLVGDERFRQGMNVPPDNSVYKPINRSHPFRIWKPYTRYPEKSAAYDIMAPDGPYLFTVPVCLAHERGNFKSPNVRSSIEYYPSPSAPYKNKITNPPIGDPYAEPQDAIIDVDPKTGVVSTRGYININPEAPFSYGIDNDFDNIGNYPFFNAMNWFSSVAAYGVSLGELFSESVVSTNTTEATSTTANGANIYTNKYSATIGPGASATQCFLIGTNQYYYYGYNSYYFGWSFYGYDDMYFYPKQSMYDDSGVLKPKITSSGSPGNNSYRRSIMYNVFRTITAPLFYTRTAIAHRVTLNENGTSYCVSSPPPSSTTTCTDTYFQSATGQNIQVPAQMKSISIGGSTGNQAQFKNGTYFCDANAIGQTEYSESFSSSFFTSVYVTNSRFNRTTVDTPYFYTYMDHG